MITQFKERRRHVRRVGQGLVVLLNGKAHPVINISVCGISFQGTGREGDEMEIGLAHLTDLKDCVNGKIKVISFTDGIVRAEFKPSVSLLRYIISHIGEAVGAEPVYFKKV